MATIQFEHVAKTYTDQDKPVKAIADISFEVVEKEFVCLIGPNGSGKSTLLTLLLNLQKPDSGTVQLEPSQPKLGFVFQNYRDSLMPWATVLDNLLLPLEEVRIPKSEKLAKAQKILAKFELSKFQDFYIYQISGGMAQLVSLARSLIIEPDLLLLDEPFSALDYVRGVKMQEMLSEVWQKDQMTTLMISHDIDEAIYLSDKIVVLSDRPAKVKKVILNDLPRPRNFKVRLSSEFDKIRKQVLQVIENNEVSI